MGRVDLSTEFALKAATDTDTGRKRANNEDFVALFEPTTVEELAKSGCLYIVADGVGGAAKGERASQYAAQKLLYEYYRFPDITPEERLERIMRQTGNDIYQFAEEHVSDGRMATTLVAAVIIGRQLIIANVGDSRAYLIRGDDARQITEDHVVENNKLTRSLGGETDVDVDIFSEELQPDDRILLCSDGLTRYIPDEEDIAAKVTYGTPDEVVKQLIAFANAKGGADNISVILIHVGGGSAQFEDIVGDKAQKFADSSLHSLPGVREQDRPTVPLLEPPRLTLLPKRKGWQAVLQGWWYTDSPKVRVTVFITVSAIVVLCGLLVITIASSTRIRDETAVSGTQAQIAQTELAVEATKRQITVNAIVDQSRGLTATAQIQKASTITPSSGASQPVPTTASYVCVMQPQPPPYDTLSGIYKKFGKDYSPDHLYDYYETCTNNTCQGKKTIPDNDSITPIWWIVIPNIIKEHDCTKNDGLWRQVLLP